MAILYQASDSSEEEIVFFRATDKRLSGFRVCNWSLRPD